MPRGGYRPPSNAKRAAVSNPRSGKRTDGMAGTAKTRQKMMEIPANGQYGYRSQTAGMAAPEGLAGSRPGTLPQGAVQTPAIPVTPLYSASQFPDRPVTHGYSVGPGLTPPPSVNDRFAFINQYKDQLETIGANSSIGVNSFLNSVINIARGNI